MNAIDRPNLIDLQKALTIDKEHNISFWDAMIVSSALQINCKVLWTEDLNSDQYLADLVVLNPFTFCSQNNNLIAHLQTKLVKTDITP